MFRIAGRVFLGGTVDGSDSGAGAEPLVSDVGAVSTEDARKGTVDRTFFVKLEGSFEPTIFLGFKSPPRIEDLFDRFEKRIQVLFLLLGKRATTEAHAPFAAEGPAITEEGFVERFCEVAHLFNLIRVGQIEKRMVMQLALKRMTREGRVDLVFFKDVLAGDQKFRQHRGGDGHILDDRDRAAGPFELSQRGQKS